MIYSKRIYSLQENEFTLPQFSIWETEHGILSWYEARLVDGEVVRKCAGPMFDKPERLSIA